MDIKQLIYFITIVEKDFNITKAAEALFISQPALSSFILTFEEKEGHALFKRHKARLKGLTARGHEFYNNALIVLEAHQQLMNSLRNSNTFTRGTVRIGIPPIVLSGLLKDLIPTFMKKHPDIQIDIIEEGSLALQEKLTLKEIDLALLIAPITDPCYKVTKLYEDTLVLLLSEKNRLVHISDRVPLIELNEEILATMKSNTLLYHQLMKWFREIPINPPIFFQSNNWDILSTVCEELNFVTLLPKFIVQKALPPNMAYKETAPSLPWTLLLAKHHQKEDDDSVLIVEQFLHTTFASL